ncbi:MAG: YdiU family protein [Oligoflexia bacterium]|nr:YdiU family protein [Oligoflexia bacterium]MBF0365320.1 YdiU family protein [Oligoflexia bacterium]
MKSLENSYLTLPSLFYSYVKPATFPQVKLLAFHHLLAFELGWSDFLESTSEEIAAYLTGRPSITPLPTPPIALAYAGHQFGHFVEQLGDGRAMVLGTRKDRQGRARDLVLKGAGQTPFSRRGDGRCPLGPALREYVVSEAMHALKIPSTRALAVVLTGEKVLREVGTVPGAVITRVAFSHIRFGSFEYFAHRKDYVALKLLSDYCIERYYPELLQVSLPLRYLEFFKMVAKRTLSLVAKWMRVGFIHGVMNTDNMLVSGETIDFGPCAFMDEYKSGQVFSSIDQGGRYAYNNQGRIAIWNLACLASALIPLIDQEEKRAEWLLNEELSRCSLLFEEFWLKEMACKFGIFNPKTSDVLLVREFLALLEKHQVDFTLGFRGLMGGESAWGGPQYALFLEKWRERLQEQGRSLEEVFQLMNENNPRVIARNHVVEKCIALATAGDLSLFHRLSRVLADPYSYSCAYTLEEENEMFLKPPTSEDRVYKTFCGT